MIIFNALQERCVKMQEIFDLYRDAFINKKGFIDDGELASLFGYDAFSAMALLDMVDFNDPYLPPYFVKDIIKNMPSLAQKTLVLDHLKSLRYSFDGIMLDYAIGDAENAINDYLAKNQA